MINDWLNDIDITIKEILESKPTKDKVVFLNSLFGVKKALNKHMEHVENVKSSIPNEYSNYLEDELDGARKYIELYYHTKDVDFLKMAYDECTHAKKFIDISVGSNSKEMEEVTKLVNQINRLKLNNNIN